MGLSIKTTNIELGINQTPSELRMNSRMAAVRLHREQCRMKIESDSPKVIIDQSKCFSEAGIKSNSEIVREAAARGYKKAMQYIGKTANDGQILAAIQNGGNAIARIAARDALKTNEFVFSVIPKTLPEIKVTGYLDIQWESPENVAMSGIEGDYVPAGLDINFKPAEVNIYVRRYPSVDIKYENKLDVLI